MKNGEKVKGNMKSKFPGIKQISHGDVMYSIGNIVNNIVITMYGVRWVLDLLGKAGREQGGRSAWLQLMLSGLVIALERPASAPGERGISPPGKSLIAQPGRCPSQRRSGSCRGPPGRCARHRERMLGTHW